MKDFGSNRISAGRAARARLLLATTSLVGGAMLSVLDTAPALAQCAITHSGTTTTTVTNNAPIDCIDIDASTVNGDVINNSDITTPGGPSGLEIGIGILNGSNVDGQVTNAGSIDALSRGIQVDATSTVSSGIANSGDIGASLAGIEVLGTVEGGIENSGNILGTGLDDGILVSSGAIIHGGILNSGDITAEDHAIRIDSANEISGGVVNAAGGQLTSRWGIRVLGTSGNVPVFDGGIANHGEITATQTGISISQTDTVTGGITNTGSITGNFGVTVFDIGSFDGGITNSDAIQATNTAVYLSDIATFTGGILNEGTVTVANGPDAFRISNIGAFTGDFVNTGTISDTQRAIFVEGSSLSGGMLNDGTITAAGQAIHVGGGSVIANGIANTGTVTGDVAILVEDSQVSTIANTGTLTGTGGTAIDLTAANNQILVEQQGGLIEGDILLSAGTGNVLAVTGGVIEGDITGQGTGDAEFDLGSGAFTYASGFAITGVDDIEVSSGTVQFDGTSDSDSISVSGGTLIVNNLSSTAVSTSVFSGATLVVGDTANPAAQLVSGGPVATQAGGFLGGYGTVVGDVDNSGTVAVADALARFTGGPGGTFTIDGSLDNLGTLQVGGAAVGNMLVVTGDYIGTNGVLNLNTVLNDDTSATDMLIVQGDTSGATSVKVTNMGGAGAQTVEGIKIIDVGGISNGTFTLLGDYVYNGEQAVVAGAYAYLLHQGGTSTPDDGDWYLRSQFLDNPPGPIPQPGVPVYETYVNILHGFNRLGTLQQRVGNRSWAVTPMPVIRDLKTWPPIEPPADTFIEDSGLWARIEGFRGSYEPDYTTSGADYKESIWKMQVGADMLFADRPTGSLLGGLTVHLGTIAADVLAGDDSGMIDTVGYGFGGTLTWYAHNGVYVDGQAQATWYESDLWSSRADVGKLADDNDGFGYALSIEAGKRFLLEQDWSLTPQAQLSYSDIDFSDFTDVFGSRVSRERGGSLVARLGLSADRQREWQDEAGRINRTHFYGIANLYYDFSDGSRVDVSAVDFISDNEALWGGLGFGGSFNWADDRYSLYGEFETKTSLENFGDTYNIAGTVGLRIRW